MEPKDYYENFKNKLQVRSLKLIEQELNSIQDLVTSAKSIGQDNLVHDLNFCYRCLLRELILIENGITSYVNQETIKAYINKVKPKDSVKIIELNRYPRVIPDEALAKIKAAKDNELFDEICVVFTDLTDKDYKTEEERKFVQRNRDPIAFGFYYDPVYHTKYSKFYFICDWVDDYCDLTFDKLLEDLAKKKLLTDDNHGELSVGDVYKHYQAEFLKLSKSNKELLKIRSSQEEPAEPEVKTLPWWRRIFHAKLHRKE